MTRLSLNQLEAGYGSTVVLRGIDLEIGPGEVVALLGRNGMGKSTLLRAIAGQLPLMSGHRAFDGRQPVRAERIAQLGVSFVPDDRGVLPTLTVDENLRLARRRDFTPAVDVAELFPVVRERAKVKAGDLSGGQKQQLAIARSILFGSRLILIDELSQGLQPSLVRVVLTSLQTMAETGVSTLFVDQSPDLPIEYADRILGMSKGSLTFDRPAREVRDDPGLLGDLLVVS